MKKCPYCAEEIQDEAIFCRYCKHDLSIKSPSINNNENQINNSTDKPVKKQWNVFWIALVFGLIMGGFVYNYRINQPITYPQFGISGKINDAILGGISSIFIYGGLYSFIVWIKRAFIKHDPNIPRFSKETGFVSIIIFVTALLMFSALNASSYSTSANQSSNKTHSEKCYIRRHGNTMQLELEGPEAISRCNTMPNSADIFYLMDGPISGKVICTKQIGEYKFTVRGIDENDQLAQDFCDWLTDQTYESMQSLQNHFPDQQVIQPSKTPMPKDNQSNQGEAKGKVVVTVINNFNNPQEVYCEGIFIFNINPGETKTFRFQKGKWRIDLCYPGTYPCDNFAYVNLNYDTFTYTIGY